MAEATRVAFGRALIRLGEQMPEIVVLDADLSCSTHTKKFAQRFPERFYQIGIAEGNMIGVAAGLALAGRIPFAASFGCFLVGRFEQIRVSVAYNRANVKLVGTHSGIGVGEDGYTQMALEDLALMRSLPNMTVVQPCDAIEAEQAVEQVARQDGPCYLRLTRQAVERVNSADYQFKLGEGVLLREGKDLLIVGSGAVLPGCLAASAKLAADGISAAVVNIHTLKPLDVDLLTKVASACGRVLTIEDHGLVGGLGSAVCEALGESGMRVYCRGVTGFGESGTAAELYQKHGLDSESIAVLGRRILWPDRVENRARG